MYTIYKYTNVQNGKVYVGRTSTTLEERAQSNGNNYKECRRFYNAIKEYSWESFVPEVLEVVDTLEEANEREIFYISLLHSNNEEYGYNIEDGGDRPIMPNESRAIISSKAKERYKDPTANPMYGKKHTESTLEKMREKKVGKNNPMYGAKWNERQRLLCGTKGKTLNLSDEQRAVLSERGRKLGEMGKRPVVCIEDNLVFSSLSDAAKEYGVNISTLCGHLGGKQHTCSGKHFRYLDDIESATTIESVAANAVSK